MKINECVLKTREWLSTLQGLPGWCLGSGTGGNGSNSGALTAPAGTKFFRLHHP